MKFYTLIYILIFTFVGCHGDVFAKPYDDLKQMVLDDNVEALTQAAKDGVDLNVVDDWGFNLLFHVRSAKMVDFLISEGIDPNQIANKSNDLQSPLHPLVIGSNVAPEVIQALLAGGADPTIKDKLGKTPIDYAKQMTTQYPKDKTYAEKLAALLK
jgi:ankyrin repeat protein